MPRRRQIAKVHARTLTWHDVTPSQHLDFFVAWRPPVGEVECSRAAWPSWESYLNAWGSVRAEGLAAWAASRAVRLSCARTKVARLAARIEQAGVSDDRPHLQQLLADAEEWAEKEASRELPFAEVAYQRVLAGTAPDGSDGEDGWHQLEEEG